MSEWFWYIGPKPMITIDNLIIIDTLCVEVSLAIVFLGF